MLEEPIPLVAAPAPVTTEADDGPSPLVLVAAAAATLGALVAAVLLFQHSSQLRAALAHAVPRVGRGAQVRDTPPPHGKRAEDEGIVVPGVAMGEAEARRENSLVRPRSVSHQVSLCAALCCP